LKFFLSGLAVFCLIRAMQKFYDHYDSINQFTLSLDYHQNDVECSHCLKGDQFVPIESFTNNTPSLTRKKSVSGFFSLIVMSVMVAVKPFSSMSPVKSPTYAMVPLSFSFLLPRCSLTSLSLNLIKRLPGNSRRVMPGDG
jgi:hypothetical protein